MSSLHLYLIRKWEGVATQLKSHGRSFLTTYAMKAVKKQIGRLRSHIASGDSSQARSDIPNMQPSAIPSDSNTFQTQSKDTGALALETQHIDSYTHEELVSSPVSQALEPRSGDSSIPNVQTKTSDITDVMQHVDPDLMKKFGRFRILIVGRANAGKTTVLQRICNSTEDPEIYDDQGRMDDFVIRGSTERGLHDINHEMVFKSNQKFVFHDSAGFEAGRKDEFEKMKNFITERANTTLLKRRIHAIWYCIPMDQFHRAVTFAEEKFFGECDTRKVPVVVLFTKWDALVIQAFQPEDLLLPLEDQLLRQRKCAEEAFTKRDVWADLCKMEFPPQAFVQLENMDTSDTGCNILLEQTAAALDDKSLQMLLITAQEKNIQLCIQYAVRYALVPYVELRTTSKKVLDLAKALASWFPHTEVKFYTAIILKPKI
ncbi:hypothetical protein J3R82DRAFT_6414 [Butyriboletus roseoflavus]|nr:hypothetical protein J3R82DRAFT_6414 [Butyriboletus roseoflavus]